MVSGSAIREKLAAFLAGHVDLEEFEDWFVQTTWNVHQAGDESEKQLVYAVELRLSEHSAGHLTEADLRGELLPFVQQYSAVVEDAQAVPVLRIQTGTSSTVSFEEAPLRSFDIRPSVVFG